MTGYTERCNFLYKELLKKRIPTCFKNLFDLENLEIALDFFQALTLAISRKVLEQNFHIYLIDQIRIQVLELDPDRLGGFVLRCEHMISKNCLTTDALVLPFSSPVGVAKHAAAIMGKIMCAAFQTQLPACDALHLLPHLILTHERSHTWDLIMLGAQNGIKECYTALEQIFYTFTLRGRSVYFYGYEHPKGKPIMDMGPQLLSYLYTNPQSDTVHLPIPLQSTHTCNRYYSKILEQRRKKQVEMTETLRLFENSEQLYQAEAARLWCEILQGRYGLRKGGIDVIKIDVPTLAAEGYRYLQLIPQEKDRHTTARFWFNGPGDLRYFVDNQLIPNQQLDYAEDQAPYPLLKTVRIMQQFIALKALHRIATGQADKAHEKSTGSKETQLNQKTNGYPRRPFTRLLPENHKMSDAAKARCQLVLGYEPPPTRTFVKEVAPELCTGTIDPAHMPSVFSYCAHDLRLMA